MSPLGKSVTTVIVIALIVLAGFYWFMSTRTSPTTDMSAMNNVATTTSTATTTATAPLNPNGSITTSPSDTSDVSLNADTVALDKDISGMTTDSTGVDQSLKDKSVQ